PMAGTTKRFGASRWSLSSVMAHSAPKRPGGRDGLTESRPSRHDWRMTRPPAKSGSPTKPAKSEAQTVAGRLLAWYDAHARVLPWRAPPGEYADPYAVWLSEIMLQQTTVAAVGPYFRAFLERWPSVGALAAAPL